MMSQRAVLAAAVVLAASTVMPSAAAHAAPAPRKDRIDTTLLYATTNPGHRSEGAFPYPASGFHADPYGVGWVLLSWQKAPGYTYEVQQSLHSGIPLWDNCTEIDRGFLIAVNPYGGATGIRIRATEPALSHWLTGHVGADGSGELGGQPLNDVDEATR